MRPPSCVIFLFHHFLTLQFVESIFILFYVGLCDAQQYRITMLVTMAKKAGLLPNLQPANSHCDPLKRRGSRKLHRYFDESTIKNPKIGWILRCGVYYLELYI